MRRVYIRRSEEAHIVPQPRPQFCPQLPDPVVEAGDHSESVEVTQSAEDFFISSPGFFCAEIVAAFKRVSRPLTTLRPAV